MHRPVPPERARVRVFRSAVHVRDDGVSLGAKRGVRRVRRHALQEVGTRREEAVLREHQEHQESTAGQCLPVEFRAVFVLELVVDAGGVGELRELVDALEVLAAGVGGFGESRKVVGVLVRVFFARRDRGAVRLPRGVLRGRARWVRGGGVRAARLRRGAVGHRAERDLACRHCLRRESIRLLQDPSAALIDEDRVSARLRARCVLERGSELLTANVALDAAARAFEVRRVLALRGGRLGAARRRRDDDAAARVVGGVVVDERGGVAGHEGESQRGGREKKTKSARRSRACHGSFQSEGWAVVRRSRIEQPPCRLSPGESAPYSGENARSLDRNGQPKDGRARGAPGIRVRPTSR